MSDDSYNYNMDHWSKIHVMWPLMRTSALKVAIGLATKVFPYLGLPKTLQSFNDRDFVNEIIKEILPLRPGPVVKYPCVEMQIQAMKQEWRGTGDAPWTDWLPCTH